MDLKCLIKLLLEKEIIAENTNLRVQRRNGDMAIAYYKYEYQEVLDKIKDSVYDNNIIRITTTRSYKLNDKYICIINMPNFINFLLDQNDKEEFTYYTGRFFLDEYTVSGIIKKFPDDIKIQRTEIGNPENRIINMRLRNKRLQAEQEKKDEVLNFINQLP